MSRSANISEVLNKKYFWDIDVELIDSEDSKQFIIDRVSTLGREAVM